MVLVEDLTKMGDTEEIQKTEKPSLLTKYNIPVSHVDFEYVEKCENGRELEKIFQIIQSGEEGYFPDLLIATEKRLTEVKPNSKYLHKVCPVLNKSQVNLDEWDDLSKDLAGWVQDTNKKDKELEGRKTTFGSNPPDSDIRQTKTYKNLENKSNPKRISATDYESWDKYDPDTEILKMDLEDEKLKKGAIIKEQKVSKTVRFQNFATEAEAIFEANREKERGNECFKAGEYQTALQHYTNSLQCKPQAVVYTNRALIHNKLKKYKKAIEDCKAALNLDSNNFKAHLRMAQNYEALEHHKQALESIENAIQIDPNNALAQQLANKVRKACGKISSKTRLMIEDVCIDASNQDSTKPLKSILKTNKNKEVTENKKTVHEPQPISKNLKSKSKNYEVISIPGSSKMPPPYYKIIYTKDPEIIRREKLKIFSRPMLLHMTTIDVGSDDENNYNEPIIDDILIEKAIEKNKRSTSIKIKDHLDSYQLENFKFNDEEQIPKENHKQTWNNIHEQNKNKEIEVMNNRGGGGEPCNEDLLFIIPSAAELQEPYTFIQTWNGARKDNSYKQHAGILKKMDFKQIHNVIGYKLDDTMLSIIINCLYKHFMVPGELDRLYSALENLIRIPRFTMMSMFLEESDRRYISQLIQFLDQHGRSLPTNIKDIYL